MYKRAKQGNAQNILLFFCHVLRSPSLRATKTHLQKLLIVPAVTVLRFSTCSGAVLCLEVDADGAVCFSGGCDATIRCWNVPGTNIDQYEPYGKVLPLLLCCGGVKECFTLC